MQPVQDRISLPPYPKGWFAVAFSNEIRRGSSLLKDYLNHKVILTRSLDGELRGSHFPGDYQDVVETHGVVLHFAGTGIRWDPPEVNSTSWSSPQCQSWNVDTHPQEILENTVDTAHFKKVHGYASLALVSPIHFRGHLMRAEFQVMRVEGLLGKWDRKPIQMRLDIEANGLGYSKVEIHIPQLALRVRQVVMPTPCSQGGVTLYATTQVKKLDPIKFLPSFINKLIPRQIIAKLLSFIAARGMAKDVSQDFSIWEHKRYLIPPLLVKGDGPIGLYRKWASQFYKSAESSILRQPLGANDE